MPALNVDTSSSATQMAAEILGQGFVINSATYFGDALSSGTYSDGDTTNPNVLPSDTGVILSTGQVSDFSNASGANNQNSNTSTNTGGQDGVAAFDAAAGNNTFDAAYLEVDFTPEPGQTSLNIEFRFYSEEYNEFVYSNFNDIALVQIDGVTVPLSVGSGEISVNAINNAGATPPTNGSEANDPNPGNGQFDSSNPNLYIDNSSGSFATEMDGFTVTLSLDIPVTPGLSQTLFIGIADVGDSSFDSSLVIASNSQGAGADVDPIATDDTGVQTWGVNPRTVDVLSNDSDPNGQSLTITQINGVNVLANDIVTLPSGQEVTLNPDGTITLVNVSGTASAGSFSYTVADSDGNTDSAFVSFTSNPICFTPGMLIETPHGPRAVESLRVGDRVLTRDHGPQPIRWIGKRRLYASGIARPIRIAPGRMGNTRALIVSPRHRLLLDDFRSQILFGEEEVLVAAKHLVDHRDITVLPEGEVCYIHLLFDRHEILLSDGIASESYHPGATSLPGLDPYAREELFRLMPQLRSDPGAFGPSARPSPKGRFAELLMR